MEILPALVLFTFSASFTPGPNNIMILTSGLNFGIRRSLAHLCGICVGVTIMLIAVGSGAGYLFARIPYLHEVIKVVGVAYLIFLAWKIAFSADNGPDAQLSKPLTFMQAALFQWVNPKALVMGTSAIATFTTVGSDPGLQIALIVLVFFLMSWPAVATWMFFGAALQKVLRTPSHLKWFNRSMAILLLASMYPVVVEMMTRYFVHLV